MKKRLVGKSLPPNQAASVFLLDDPTVANDRQAMAYCEELVRWRARPTTIEQLLGISAKVAKRVVIREHEEQAPLVGRLPSHFSPVFGVPSEHLQCSLFHRAYAEAAHILDDRPGSSGVCTTPFMDAYRVVTQLVPLAEREITVESAIVFARHHHAGDLRLACCPNCNGYYSESTSVVTAASVPTRGACPYCRVIAVRNRRAIVLAPHQVAHMRSILGLAPAAGEGRD